jgi:hypothetical protein
VAEGHTKVDIVDMIQAGQQHSRPAIHVDVGWIAAVRCPLSLVCVCRVAAAISTGESDDVAIVHDTW